MKTYTIYFELFGKKMKTTVEAENVDQAKRKIKDKIVFHKVEENNPFEYLKNIFGI
jgi:hypothetical protein